MGRPDTPIACWCVCISPFHASNLEQTSHIIQPMVSGAYMIKNIDTCGSETLLSFGFLKQHSLWQFHQKNDYIQMD